MHPLRTHIIGLQHWQTSKAATDALLEAGPEGLNAIKDGMRDDDWRIRLTCAEFLDHFADQTCVDALLMALKDGKQDVRRHAFHSISCQTCKKEPLGLDLIPVLLEAAGNDRSLKVRRTAASSLCNQAPDERAIEPLRALLPQASDPKLKNSLQRALEFHSRAPVASVCVRA